MQLQSESLELFATAFASAQAMMHPAVINKVNPHFKNKYADLASVIAAVRKPLADNQMGFTQETHLLPGPAMVLVTTLLHKSGQFIRATYPLPLNAKPQELGSALTYARRYSLASICGIAADEDDDGQEAANANGAIVEAKVTPEQAKSIVAAADAKGVTTAAVCTYYDIARITDLPASKFDGAMKKLGAKEAEK